MSIDALDSLTGAFTPARTRDAASAVETSTRGISTRAYLVLLSLGILAPLLVFAGYLILREATTARALAETELRQVPKQISLILDREFANQVTLLEALASSPSLRARDFAHFHDQAANVRALPGVNITLRDATGRMLVNARVGYVGNQSLPVVVRDHDAELIRDKRPIMSNVNISPTRGSPVVSTAIPIIEDGEVRYIMQTNLPSEHFAPLLRDFGLAEGMRAFILDRNDEIVTASDDGPASSASLEPLKATPDAPPESAQRITLNGVPVVAVQARSDATGWRIIATAPEATVRAPINRLLQVLLLLGLTSLASALLLAFTVGRQISKAIGSLAATGSGLLQSNPPPFADTPLTEVNKVARIIGAAGRQLRETEERLRHSEAGLKESLRVGGACSFEIDIAADSIKLGGIGPKLLGLSNDEGERILSARAFRAHIHPLDYSAALASVRKLRPGRADLDIRFRYTRSDGGDIWLGLRATGQFDAAGDLVKVVGLAVDMTAQARAEEAQARLAAIVENSNDAIISVRPGGDILTWNAGAARMFGYEADEVVGKSIALLAPPESADIKEQVRRMREIGVLRLETVRVAKDGRRIDVQVSARSVDLPDGTRGSSAILTDITERKRAEARQKTLINELNHRVKNTLATIQSIAAHTFRDHRHAEGLDKFVARLMALSRAHNVLTSANWEGASLAEVVAMTIAPHQTDDSRRFNCVGPVVRLSPRAALAISMALHELCTNAAKYGALSDTLGRISIAWEIAPKARERTLKLTWVECDGPRVEPPDREGFGTTLVRATLADDLDADVSIEFAPTGLVCRFEAPLPAPDPTSEDIVLRREDARALN